MMLKQAHEAFFVWKEQISKDLFNMTLIPYLYYETLPFVPY